MEQYIQEALQQGYIWLLFVEKKGDIDYRVSTKLHSSILILDL